MSDRWWACLCRGLQDELFNLTLDLFKVQAERTRAEAKLDGSIQRVQLDNQMLDATQPVVLAPASAAHAHAESGVSRVGQQPLVRFGIVRSFANSLPSGSLGEAAGTPSMPATPKAAQGATSVLRREGDILSFRSLYLDVGEVDVQTDGAPHIAPAQSITGVCEVALLACQVTVRFGSLACMHGNCGPDSVG